MKKVTSGLLALLMIFSVVFVSSALSSAALLSVSGQTRTERVAKHTKRSGRKVVHRSWRSTKKVSGRVYTKSRYVAHRGAEGTRSTAHKTKVGTKKIVHKTKDAVQ